jgi:hypothetical protein
VLRCESPATIISVQGGKETHIILALHILILSLALLVEFVGVIGLWRRLEQLKRAGPAQKAQFASLHAQMPHGGISAAAGAGIDRTWIGVITNHGSRVRAFVLMIACPQADRVYLLPQGELRR